MDTVRARVTVAPDAGAAGARGGGDVLAVTRELLTAGGARALYRGLVPTLGAVVPFVAVQNTCIDLAKVWGERRRK